MDSIQAILDQMRREDCGDGVRTENFSRLLDFGLDLRVACKLDDIFKTGKLAYSELDQRACEALKEFFVDGALEVLDQFLDSNLEHVSNKSAFLCGIMKTYRQKARAIRDGIPITSLESPPVRRGPDAESINRILDRTGYELDVTNGKISSKLLTLCLSTVFS
jgi:heterogeneous nuclear ribonucleoprotein R